MTQHTWHWLVVSEDITSLVTSAISYSGPPSMCLSSIREKIRCILRFFWVFLCGFWTPLTPPSLRYHLFPVFLKRQKTKLFYLACDFLGAPVYQLTNYVSMIVLFIVPFMFPSKLSSVLFIFTSTSASYYVILKVSVMQLSMLCLRGGTMARGGDFECPCAPQVGNFSKL